MERLFGDQVEEDQDSKENRHPTDNGFKECALCACGHNENKCLSRDYSFETTTENFGIVETVAEEVDECISSFLPQRQPGWILPCRGTRCSRGPGVVLAEIEKFKLDCEGRVGEDLTLLQNYGPMQLIGFTNTNQGSPT